MSVYVFLMNVGGAYVVNIKQRILQSSYRSFILVSMYVFYTDLQMYRLYQTSSQNSRNISYAYHLIITSNAYLLIPMFGRSPHLMEVNS